MGVDVSFSCAGAILLSCRFRCVRQLQYGLRGPLSVPLLNVLRGRVRPLPTLPRFHIVEQFPNVSDRINRVTSTPLAIYRVHDIHRESFTPPFFVPRCVGCLPTVCCSTQANRQGRLHTSAFRKGQDNAPKSLTTIPRLPIVPSGPMLQSITIQITPVKDGMQVTTYVNARTNLICRFQVLEGTTNVLYVARASKRVVFLTVYLVPYCTVIGKANMT